MTNVTNLTLNSALGTATIELKRQYSGQRGDVDDLPHDMLGALRTWLGPDPALTNDLSAVRRNLAAAEQRNDHLAKDVERAKLRADWARKDTEKVSKALTEAEARLGALNYPPSAAALLTLTENLRADRSNSDAFGMTLEWLDAVAKVAAEHEAEVAAKAAEANEAEAEKGRFIDQLFSGPTDATGVSEVNE